MTDGARRLLTALLLAASAARAAALTALETQGKTLYFGGVGTSGRPIQAYLAGGSEPVDADAVPCAGCHGEDGRGRSEGGIVPGDITWSNLTKPYGHNHGAGRKHPAFSERSLAAAVTQGVDPAGNPLDPVMPRYLLKRADLAALTAYLKRIEADPPPGVETDRLRLGIIAPLRGPQETAGRDLMALLTAYVDELNGRGGIYNRRIELIVADATADRQQTLANVRKLITATPVLATIGALVPTHEAAVAELLDRAGVPLIGGVADFPRPDARSAFYLADGLPERLRGLTERLPDLRDLLAGPAERTAAAAPARPQLAVVVPPGTGHGTLLDILDAAATAKGWPAPQRLGWEAAPSDAPAGTVIFIGTESELATRIAAGKDPGRPLYLFLPAGGAVGSTLFDLPSEAAARLVVAPPCAPPDPASASSTVLRDWQRKAGIGDRSLCAEMLVLGAIRVLTEGIKRAGSEPSRARLVTALEGLRQFDAVPLPPLDFSPSRHIGRAGTPLLAIDRDRRRFRTLGGSVPEP